MPVGRPPKTTEQLTSNWQHIILENMSQGASLEEIKPMIGVFGNDTHTRLMERDEEYRETIKKGIELSKSWWLNKGRSNLENKEFSATLWYMNMKNRFGWRDNVDHTTQGQKLPTPIYNGGSSGNQVPISGHNSDSQDIPTK